MSNGNRWAAAGLTAFAALMMIMSGLWAVFVGIAALTKDKFFVITPEYVYKIDITGWGWIHLILGIFVAVAGVCLLLGQTWARVVAIFLAILSAISQFFFVPYYPLWSILIIALDIFVIWALLTATDRAPV
jgi:hypothetical protein